MDLTVRKPLLISTLLLTSFGFASPWILGVVAENQFNTELADIKSESEYGDLTISNATFERGYLGSKASLNLTLDDASGEIPSFSILIESDLTHVPVTSGEFGVLVFEVYSKDSVTLVDAPEEVKKFVAEQLGGTLLSGYSHANVMGNYDSVLSSPEFKFTSEEENLAIDLAPIKISAQGNVGGSFSNFTVSIPTSSINTADFSAQLSDITGHAEMEEHSSGLELGESGMNIGQLTVNSEKGGATFTNMSIAAISQIVNNKVNTNIVYNIEAVNSPLPLTSASYDIDLNGFTLESAGLMDNLQEHLENIDPESFTNDEYFNELLEATFQPGLQLNQEMKINAFGGDWLANLDIEFNGLEGVELSELADPKVGVKAISAQMLIKADSNAILQSPAANMIDPLMQQGFIKLEDGSLVSVASLMDGKLTLNEQDIPVEPLINALLAKIEEAQQETAAN